MWQLDGSEFLLKEEGYQESDKNWSQLKMGNKANKRFLSRTLLWNSS